MPKSLSKLEVYLLNSILRQQKTHTGYPLPPVYPGSESFSEPGWAGFLGFSGWEFGA